jgi:two-component system OmpR family response regulator
MRLTDTVPTVPPHPRVLYVDDNADLADTALMLLTLSGYEARAAYDGPAAVRVAAAFEPAVCFIDLNMPGMDGDEVAVRLRAQTGGRELLLAAVTAMGGEATVARLSRAGFHFHLLKPADPDAMLAVLQGRA